MELNKLQESGTPLFEISSSKKGFQLKTLSRVYFFLLMNSDFLLFTSMISICMTDIGDLSYHHGIKVCYNQKRVQKCSFKLST